jgi:hypothetical protein
VNPDGTLHVPGLDPIVLPSSSNQQQQPHLSTAKKNKNNVSFMDVVAENNPQLDGGLMMMDMDIPAPPGGGDDYYNDYNDDGGVGGGDMDGGYGFNDRLTQDDAHTATPIRPVLAGSAPENDDQQLQVPAFNLEGANNNNNNGTTTTALNSIQKNYDLDLHDLYATLPGSKAIRKGRSYRLPKKSTLTDDEKFLQFLNGGGKKTGEEEEKEKEIYSVGMLQPFKDMSSPLFYEALMPLYKLKQSLERKRRFKENMNKKKNGQNNKNNNELEEEERYHNLFELPQKGGGEEKKDSDIPPELDFIYGNDDNNNNDGYDDFGDMGGGGGDDDGYFGPLSTENVINNNNVIIGPDGQPVAAEDHEVFDADEEAELTKRVAEALRDDLIHTGNNTYQNICKQYIEGFQLDSSRYAK